MSKLETFTKILKTASGVQGYQDRKEAKTIRERSQELYDSAAKKTDSLRVSLNNAISDFGKLRLESLRNCVGRFLMFLKDMDQKNAQKHYEILDGIQISQQSIQELGTLEMNASKALASSAVVGIAGTAAAMGTAAVVPGLITGAVVSVGAASTGTAISTLSGVAATNAILAWLGGGSLAAGGGGVAAGAATLGALTTAATVGATGGVAILAAGLLASTHYSKKLTEAKEYEKEAEIAVERMKAAWVLMEGISKRTEELTMLTKQLDHRAVDALDLLEPLAPEFESSHEYYLKSFQTCGILVKAVSELAQAPLLDNNGNVSDESSSIQAKTHQILNSEL